MTPRLPPERQVHKGPRWFRTHLSPQFARAEESLLNAESSPAPETTPKKAEMKTFRRKGEQQAETAAPAAIGLNRVEEV